MRRCHCSDVVSRAGCRNGCKNERPRIDSRIPPCCAGCRLQVGDRRWFATRLVVTTREHEPRPRNRVGRRRSRGLGCWRGRTLEPKPHVHAVWHRRRLRELLRCVVGAVRFQRPASNARTKGPGGSACRGVAGGTRPPGSGAFASERVRYRSATKEN